MISRAFPFRLFTAFMLALALAQQAGSGAVSAEDGAVIIHAVEPAPPYCVLRNSPRAHERLLELDGQNFAREGQNLQFLKVSTGDLSIHFHLEVEWQSTTRIVLDMARIQHLLWPDRRVVLAVRITSSALQPVSGWSPAFVLADDTGACGVSRPTVTPTPSSTPSPVPGPTRGVSGDLWADIIIGQQDFAYFTPHEVVPYKVFNPGGVTVDRAVHPGRAYVWDSGNSRILGIDLAACYATTGPCQAAIVLGQPSASKYSACNGDSGFQRYPDRAPAGANTLCGIPEDTLSILENKSFVSMAVDHEGDLYVPDHHNHRILKYVSPFTTDTIADEIWGHTDFTGNLCNHGAISPSASSLCFASRFHGEGSAVELDSGGNLWVADTGNNRVLRFPRDGHTDVIAKTADLVLGQPSFASASSGSELDAFDSPSALAFRSNGWLYVADTRNNRVLVFRPPFHSGMSADATFGSDFVDPLSLEVDPDGEGIWVFDRGNSMIELWDWDGVTVRRVLGKDVYRLGHDWNSPVASAAGGIGIDAEGNILVAVYVYGQDVLRFSSPVPAPQPGRVYQPSKRLFSPPYGYNNVGSRGFRSPSGVAVYGHQLIVCDGRLLWWNDTRTLWSGQPADGFIGSSEFSFFPDSCGRVKTDSASGLWVQRPDGGIDRYQLPLTAGSTPLTVMRPSMQLQVLGAGSLVVGRRIEGLAPVGLGQFLWVSDWDNHRVLRIRDPLTHPVVDVVLGQTDANGNQCNRGIVQAPNTGTTAVATADMLCAPGALSLDRLGNLYVSDHSLEVEGNWRLLVFPASLFPRASTVAVFAPPASKVFPYRDVQPAITWEPAFDSTNRMVVGYNGYLGGRFVGVYDDPLAPETSPTTYLRDYGSMPYTAVFDMYDNLYVGDCNRNRVLVYWDPFQSPLSWTDTYLPVIGGGR